MNQLETMDLMCDIERMDIYQSRGAECFHRKLRLASAPSAPAHARRCLRQALLAWDLEGISDTAMLLASELVTNAVKAAGRGHPDPRSHRRPPMIEFDVLRLGESLVIEVWDAAAERPALRNDDLLDEDGRGLFLVESLSSGWGHFEADRGGKVVWCEITIAP